MEIDFSTFVVFISAASNKVDTLNIFFSNSNELADKDGKEFKSDFISKMIIGFGF